MDTGERDETPDASITRGATAPEAAGQAAMSMGGARGGAPRWRGSAGSALLTSGAGAAATSGTTATGTSGAGAPRALGASTPSAQV